MPNPQRSLQPQASPQGAQAAESKLDVSAQILSFEPGLYSVEVFAPQIHRGATGMTVPCIRLDPIPAGDDSRAFVSALSDSPLIRPNDAATYLRVQGATASVLLTIYKLAGGMAAPELRISLVPQNSGRATKAAVAAALPSEKLTLMAHVERAGDVAVQAGLWAGQPGGRGAIEGFSVTPGDRINPGDIEYQAVLGSDWTTPWLPGGEFCGSRGLSLPLLGARIRLRGEAAKQYSVSYWGSFFGSGEIGPINDGAVCGGGGAPMEALRVVLSRRQTQATATLVNHPSSPNASAPSSIAVAQAPGKARTRAAVPTAAGAKPPLKQAKVEKITALTSIRSKLGRK